MQTKLEHF